MKKEDIRENQTVSVRGKIVEVIYDKSLYPIVSFDGNEAYINPALIQPYTEPAPVVWRDGYKAWSRQDIGDIVCRYKDTENKWWVVEPKEYTLYTKTYWAGLLWLPADEFPMPAMPEQKINPCPFCGYPCETGQNFTGDGGVEDRFVKCTGCAYTSGSCSTKQEAIKAHNKLARK